MMSENVNFFTFHYSWGRSVLYLMSEKELCLPVQPVTLLFVNWNAQTLYVIRLPLLLSRQGETFADIQVKSLIF